MDQRTFLSLIAGALCVACGGEQVTHVRVAKSADAPPAPTSMMGMPGHADTVAPPAPMAEDDAGRLQWKLPAGWSEKKETGMRFATLKPSGAGKVEVSVVVLPGSAGGELANVNRWRGQLGLAPIDDAQLEKLRKPMDTDAGQLRLFDLLSEGQAKSRTLAAVLNTEAGNSWFVKMTGDADAVRARQPEFLRLLASLHFGAAGKEQQP